MSTFKPGDKVQLLNENLKGIITGHAGNHRWLVEIEDGFEIPLDERELVHAEGQEESTPASETPDSAIFPACAERQKQEVLLVFRKGDKENELLPYLVNHLPCPLLFTIHFKREKTLAGFTKAEIEANGHLRLGLLNMRDFDHWNRITLHGLLYAPPTEEDLPLSFSHTLQLNARKFMRSLTSNNPFGEEAHVFNVFNPQAEAGAEAQEEQKSRMAFTLESPPDVVDLHIEEVADNYRQLTPAEMLQQQMAYFEACLERAIALNYDKITFIHGAGQGILKNKIRSALVKVKEVRKVRDADPEIYGGGATEVVFG